MTNPRLRIAVIVLVFALVFLAGWLLMYPSSGDPKNIKYVLWKAGLYKMNPDVALATMIGDADRDKLVLGKTKEQLSNQFGFLLLPADASPYLEELLSKFVMERQRRAFPPAEPLGNHFRIR
jgi:hypothetical protein